MSKKISELTAATDVTASDLFQVVDIEDPAMASSGTNKKVTAQTLGNYLPVRALGSTTSRTLSARFADTVNVKDFGAAGDGIQDDSAAFQAAINALSSEGGKITVPSGSYKLNTEPTWGTKSVYWDISTGCVFTGTGTGFGKFPYMETNPGQAAVGPWIQSQTSQIGGAALNGGIASLSVEMLQPASVTTGQSVAGYFGAKGSSPSAGANVWALNTLIRADAGAAGSYQCVEVDVDVFSAAAFTKGISISGGGTQNADVGFEITRLNTTVWNLGIYINKAQDGIKINPPVNARGIIIGEPAALPNTAVSVKQYADDSTLLFLQRKDDTTPTGHFMRGVNSDNSLNMFTLDAYGNFANAGNVATAHVQLKAGATSTSAGRFSLGSTNQQTVGAAGAASALPSNPRGYLIAYDGPTKVVIPYYLA